MKTTLDLDDWPLVDAKSLAARQRIGLTRLIEEGLHQRLRSRPSGEAPVHPVLPAPSGRGGLVPGSIR